MQHEKVRTVGCPGLLFNSTCFCTFIVCAVRFPCTEKSNLVVVYMWELWICIDHTRFQENSPFKMCHMCMQVHALSDLSLCP